MSVGVTKDLTPHERRVARRLKQEGFKHPFLMVAAAKEADIQPATAAALVNMETGDGSMIFGCDHGPGRAFCHEKVTKTKVQALLASPLANGVGATQLTFKPFVEEADAAGGAHRYYPNVLTGFSILRRNFDANGGSLRTAYRIYNGSGDDAEEYADKAMAKREEYKRKLEIVP
jgi:hypothetical protein